MEENKQNGLKDPFAEAIRSKLAHHTMLVDDALWKGVQQRMAPKKRILPFWLISSLSAAAGLALLITVGSVLLLQDKTPEKGQLVQNTVEPQVQITQPEIETEEIVNDTKVEEARMPENQKITAEKPVKQTQPVNEQAVEVQKTKSGEQNPVVETVGNKSDNSELAAVTVQQGNSAKGLTAAVEEKTAKVETKSTQNNEVIEKEAVARVEKQPAALTEEILRESEKQIAASNDWTREKIKQKGMQVAAGIGSGVAGTSALFTAGKSMDYLSESFADVASAAVNINAPGDYSNKDYLPPITVGILFRKTLTDNFAIESGLLYSYLLTKMSGTNWGNGRAEMNLHYLGIPVNLVTTLMKAKPWEINFSLGGAVEKGLWSVYNQYEDWGMSTRNTEVEAAIDGLQFSVSAALGFSYRINNESAFFLDPKLSFYFEGDQPFSIRTEMPLQLGVNAGIRFDL